MSKIVVLGAAGFLGSHLCDALVARGESVVGIDDLSSGSKANLSQLANNKNFAFYQHNIIDVIKIHGSVDAVLNFASPASPIRYQKIPIQTMMTGSIGTNNALCFARDHGARLIMASTSEVYGEPLVHPQTENYWGNVNPIGERSCYDEAKRFSEALCMAYASEHNQSVGIVRIFNTYGPRLRIDDGRVVSNFICQALKNEPLTIFGDGSQTRSFCFVSDQIKGILALLDSGESGPVNIGSPFEINMLELAGLVIKLTGSSGGVINKPKPSDDPSQRRPDIALAQKLLSWNPKVDLETGLNVTINWFKSEKSG